MFVLTLRTFWDWIVSRLLVCRASLRSHVRFQPSKGLVNPKNLSERASRYVRGNYAPPLGYKYNEGNAVHRFK
jgi:hypothetical protein